MQAPESARDRILAVICQLWCWLGPFLVVPLIVRVTLARDSAILHEVTGEVLNLQLVAAIPTVLGVLAVVVGANAVALAFWASFAIVAVYGYTVGLVGAFRAWNGTAWAYPLNLHVIAR